ncbi:hypothetical protein [Devosia sp. SL43]|uniref:hypothetical protein n=1 Tax=Devosia sp. SL43 TaxID=2806348 RepID=UPI001F47E714|nr:hypothetical protein [Devosia sp. SL43]UJW85013.1 hypothetical protein IM737_16615 [Devosia sp. SL43]
MDIDRSVLDWLLSGDISIQYQVRRDLLGEDDPRLLARIAEEGWGAGFLARRNADGSWGQRFYQPKWTSSHYTLLDLRTLGLPPDNALARASVHKIAVEEKIGDGGIGPTRTIKLSDVCVNGMFLNYASYFGEPEVSLCSIIDYILGERMADGGFNCWRLRPGAAHSSLHSTLSVLEGIQEYAANGYRYRLAELQSAARTGRDFILDHRLFRSRRTGEIIGPDMLRFVFPPRWKYNVLRSLDYFRTTRTPWDERMSDALDKVVSKRRPDGRWALAAGHPGQVHFVMEKAGQPSRWNTLLALRVLRAYLH